MGPGRLANLSVHLSRNIYFFPPPMSVVGRGRNRQRGKDRATLGLSFKTARSYSPGPTANLFPTITGRTTSCGKALWTHLGDSEDIRTRSLRDDRPLGSAVRDCVGGDLASMAGGHQVFACVIIVIN